MREIVRSPSLATQTAPSPDGKRDRVASDGDQARDSQFIRVDARHDVAVGEGRLDGAEPGREARRVLRRGAPRARSVTF
jgi:hypothetical protein